MSRRNSFLETSDPVTNENFMLLTQQLEVVNTRLQHLDSTVQKLIVEDALRAAQKAKERR